MTTDTDVELQRKHAVALLKPYVQARRERDQYKEQVEQMAKLLRSWLDGHPEEELYDGEHGITARLQQRRGQPTLDWARLSPELLAWLAAQGCLAFLPAQFAGLQKAQLQPAGQVEPFILKETAGTVALLVQEEQ